MSRQVSNPLRAGVKGYFALCGSRAQEISERIKQVIFVEPQERFMRSRIGMPLLSMVFEPVDEVFTGLFESLASAQIERYLPWFSLSNIVISREELEGGGGVRVYLHIIGQDLEEGTDVDTVISRVFKG